VGRRSVATVALVCFGGCASTATIARTDGPDTEARIVNSDLGAVYVRARNQQIYRIPRESVMAIDHPGNVEIIVGSILVGLVGLAIFQLRDEGDSDAILPVGLVYGTPGLALITSGLLKYVPSVQAASAYQSFEPPRNAPPGMVWAPPLPAPPPPAARPPQQPATPPAAPAPPAPTPPPLPPEPPPEEPEVIPGAT
jgi:hypothetical protein